MPSDDPPLKADDYVLRGAVPEWLPGPLRRVARDFTYDEAHAMLLGLVGLPAGTGWYYGHTDPVGAFTVAVITLALGLRAAPNDLPVAGRLVQYEPWYFTTMYVASAAFAYWTFVVVS